MKLGLCSYSNRASGVGLIAADLARWLPVDSMLSFHSVKGQQRWLDRQVTLAPSHIGLEDYFTRYTPDVLLGIETIFSTRVYAQCRAQNIKTAVVMMHESYRPGLPTDLFICPTQIAYERIEEDRKVFYRWPVDIEPFPFKLRREARRFLHVVGYGMRNNRRQTREVVAGFLVANIPGATLTIHCQRDWREAYGKHDDPRIEYRLQTFANPANVYDGFDVLLQPDSYAGYNRLLYEAQACGLPVITTDAPPMDECETPFFVAVERQEWYSPEASPGMEGIGRCMNVARNLVTADAVAEAVTAAAGPGQADRSKAARHAAERRAWTKERAAELVELLEDRLDRR